MTTILVADGEAGIREMLAWQLADRGYDVVCARDGNEVIAALDTQEFDIVLSDLRMSGRDGVHVLQTSKQIAPDTEVVIATGCAEIDHALECVKAGAFDYIHKPYDINHLVATLERAAERRLLRAASALLHASRVILDTREPHRLPEVIVGVAMKAMNADDVTLLMPGHDDQLYTACSSALTDSIRQEARAATAELVTAKMPMLREAMIETAGNVHAIVYPLCVGERLIAVLMISRVVNPRPFRRLDLERAAMLASQILLALDNMRLARETIAAERLATVGQVATSIAHEVNNPISYVLASQAHLKDQLVHVVELCRLISSGADIALLRATFEQAGAQRFIDELLQAAEDVREGACRVRDILLDTRALSHNPELKPAVFDVNEAIKSALRVTAAELRHKATVTTVLRDGLLILGTAGRISQVFVNLLINAAEAFGVNAYNAVAISSKRVGGDVVITVRDNGPGIDADSLPRIFETLKAATSGTVLGLPISRDIVRGHGGEISVVSSPGTGTCFSIVLPLAAVPRAHSASNPPPSVAPRVRLRILFVDDEPNIRRAYTRAFGKEHDVVAAEDGQHALRLIAQHGDFDLVVCDLSMPMMSGMQLFQLVRDQNPRLAERFVFATGGASQHDIEAFLGSVPNRVLEKPFDLSVLRELIGELQRMS